MKLVLLLLLLNSFYGQENEVTYTFFGSRLINLSTTEQISKNTYEVRINHRFGDSYKGAQNFLGLDDGANTYLSFDFALSDNVKIGFGRESDTKAYEINTQYKLFNQLRDESMPVSVAFVFSGAKQTLEANKTGYIVSQLLIARKFSKEISIEVAPFYLQRLENKDVFEGAQPLIGVSLAGQYRITKHSALIFEWSPSLNVAAYNKNTNENIKDIKYESISFGYSVEAGGHTFQMVMSNSRSSNLTHSLLGSQQNLFERHFYLGFNITRLFVFSEEE
jgi:hypothetical protein